MLKVENLNKTYPLFRLKDLTFHLETGYILGFIGLNGAGKSTALKSILNIVKPDSGTVQMFGKNMAEHELALKQRVGFSLGAFEYYPRNKLKQIARIYRRFYEAWDDERYELYLKKFCLDENKRVKELSQGMKVKFSLALALSHNSKLLILDEPTSGLDPLAREEILEIFQEIVEDGEHSILFSTHITSDLDKIADYILFIKDGSIAAYDTKEDLLASHVLISGSAEEWNEELENRAIGFKNNRFGFKALILRERLKDSDPLERETPNLEDIMIYYNKEAHNEGISGERV